MESTRPPWLPRRSPGGYSKRISVAAQGPSSLISLVIDFRFAPSARKILTSRSHPAAQSRWSSETAAACASGAIKRDTSVVALRTHHALPCTS